MPFISLSVFNKLVLLSITSLILASISLGSVSAASPANTIIPSEWNRKKGSTIVTDAPKGSVLKMNNVSQPGYNAVSFEFASAAKKNKGKKAMICVIGKSPSQAGVVIQMVAGPSKNLTFSDTYTKKCFSGNVRNDINDFAGAGSIQALTNGRIGTSVFIDTVTISFN